MKFNFTRLHAPFMEAIKRKSASIAFALQNGKGKFVFLLFVPSDNKGQIRWNELDVYVILGRTQRIINPVLSGFFTQGNFIFEFSSTDEDAILAELDIKSGGGRGFNFSDFCESLNQEIPQSISQASCFGEMQGNRALILERCSKHIDTINHRFLLRHVPLSPNKKPRDETLRKLIYLSKDPRVISGLISQLKRLNWSLAWTDVDPGTDHFTKIWEKAAAASAKTS